jgi:hypothetical protein
LRDRPIIPSPTNIVAHVDGSGIGAIGRLVTLLAMSKLPNRMSLERLKIVIDKCPNESTLYVMSSAENCPPCPPPAVARVDVVDRAFQVEVEHVVVVCRCAIDLPPFETQGRNPQFVAPHDGGQVALVVGFQRTLAVGVADSAGECCRRMGLEGKRAPPGHQCEAEVEG